MAHRSVVESARQSVRFVSGVDVAAGAWLALAPVILAYSAIRDAVWNDMIVGLVVLTLAFVRIGSPLRSEGLRWINFALRVWLLFAPSLLSYGDTPGLASEAGTAIWNDVIVGAVVLLMAASSATSAHRGRAHLMR
jgi:hypothetical protein